MLITNELRPLTETAGRQYADSTRSYFEFYGLDLDAHCPGLEHLFGTFASDDFLLTGHIFRPADYKATVILLHGYFDHCGQLTDLAEHLIDQNFAVAMFDLPGHGLSSGEPIAIDNFSQYSKSLEDFTTLTKTLTHGPHHIIAHSTGASAVIDHLLFAGTDPFDKVALAAPLVQNAAFKSSKQGYKFYTKFADSVPRIFRKNSGDPEFLKFLKDTDPLQAHKVSLKWVNALHLWNDRVEAAEKSKRSLMIIQGDEDSTVAWQYNIKLLKSKFTNIEIEMIKGARHALFNESEKFKTIIFDRLNKYLAE